MAEDNTDQPQIASATIAEVLEEFLEDQRARLKPRTVARYEQVIDLLQESINGYGYEWLDEEEQALFDRLYNAEGDEHREFCQIFGPEHILENVREFLDYFMIRKVAASQALLRAAGTVTKKLAQWLAKKGYDSAEEADSASELASRAAKVLPAAEELADLLYHYARATARRQWSERADEQFRVKKVEPGKLWLSGALSREPIVVPVSQEISDRCQVGWWITLLLGKTSEGWRIIETGNVYPL